MARRDSYTYILGQLERIRRIAELAEHRRRMAPVYRAMGSTSEAGPVSGSRSPDQRMVDLATSGLPPDEAYWQRYLEALERRLTRLADDQYGKVARDTSGKAQKPR